MILKTALALSFAATTPLLFVAADQHPQEPTRPGRQAPAAHPTVYPEDARPERAAAPRSDEVERLRREVERLRRRVEAERERAQAQRDRAAEAEAEIAGTLEQLREALDMLTSEEQGERNCSPSRSMITRHEWLIERGHEDHADRMIERISATYRHDLGRLNRLAWNLMTNDETVGRYDRTALAIARRIESHFESDDLPHPVLDTIAFANFLNGSIDRAIELEQSALELEDRSDYRRRLRTYEAAQLAMERALQRRDAATTGTLAGSGEEARAESIALQQQATELARRADED